MLFGGWWFWGGLVGWCGGGEVEVDCRISKFSCSWGGGNSFSARDPRGFWVLWGAFRGLRGFLFRDPPFLFLFWLRDPPPFRGGWIVLATLQLPDGIGGSTGCGSNFSNLTRNPLSRPGIGSATPVDSGPTSVGVADQKWGGSSVKPP